MKKAMILLFVLAIAAAGCESRGKSYTFNKTHHVYYKGDGVTEDDAKRLAEYFKQIGYFGEDNTSDVQLVSTKEKPNDITVRFIVDKAKLTPEIENGYMTVGNDVREKIFPGKTVAVVLADEELKDVKDLGTGK